MHMLIFSYFIVGNLTAEQYVFILENSLLPAADIFPNGYNFVQDNSSVHTAKLVDKWLKGHSQIKMLPWPPKAQDLNPIENVWGIMVNKFRSENGSKKFLWGKVLDCWEDLAADPDVWIDLFYSIPDRLNECIKYQGSWTSY